jgi:hypothetical protein
MRPILGSSLVRRALACGALACGALACGRSKSASTGDDGGAPGAPSAALALLAGFEGEIDVVVNQNKPGDSGLPLSLFVRNDKVRVDVPEKLAQAAGNFVGAKAYVIFDSPAKKLSIVSDAQKQAIVVDLNKSGEQLRGFKGPAGPPHGGAAPATPTTKLTKTGKFDTVAGYKCENWDVSADHREATVCVAQEGASWFSIPMTGIPTERLWMAELFDGKHFPLRLVSYGNDGTTEASRVEVTRIDKKTPSASLFEYPSTYRVVDLGQMFAGLAAMQGGALMPTMPPVPVPAAGPRAKVH